MTALGKRLADICNEFGVNLAFFHEVGLFVAANIVRGERLFERDIREADEFELYVLRRAGDLAHLEWERQAIIMEEG